MATKTLHFGAVNQAYSGVMHPLEKASGSWSHLVVTSYHKKHWKWPIKGLRAECFFAPSARHKAGWEIFNCCWNVWLDISLNCRWIQECDLCTQNLTKIKDLKWQTWVHKHMGAVLINGTTIRRLFMGMETTPLTLLKNFHAPRISQTEYTILPATWIQGSVKHPSLNK